MGISGMKEGVVMMIIMLIIVQAYGDAPHPQAKSGHKFRCDLKCPLQCAEFLLNKIRFGLCMGTCIAHCHRMSRYDAYECLNNCSLSRSPHANNDDRGLAIYAHSCLEDCKKE